MSQISTVWRNVSNYNIIHRFGVHYCLCKVMKCYIGKLFLHADSANLARVNNDPRIKRNRMHVLDRSDSRFDSIDDNEISHPIITDNLDAA